MKIIQLLVFFSVLLLNSRNLLSVTWEGQIDIDSQKTNYKIEEGKDKYEVITNLDNKKIVGKSLIKLLRECEQNFSAHNCLRFFCFPCTMCISPIGCILSYFEKRKVVKLRLLIEAAYEENSTAVLERFKDEVTHYLAQIASEEIAVPTYKTLCPNEVEKWKNIQTEDIRVLFKQINIAGSCGLVQAEGNHEEINIEVLNCCLCSVSEAPFDVHEFIELFLYKVEFLEKQYPKNFKGLIQSRLERKLKGILSKNLLIARAAAIASL